VVGLYFYEMPMRRLFARRRSLYPIRSCHFCCVESWIVPPHPLQDNNGDTTGLSSTIASSSTGPQISTGSVSNWYCSSCQCWNRADPNEIGGVASWDPKMSNDQQNIESLQKRATLPASSSDLSVISSRFRTSSSFCHSCQTNQTLILSILANGDTDEMDEAAIQQWQMSLQARYPPVCDQCRVMVADRVENADKTARRLIWNSWLRKSREKGAISSPRRAQVKPSEVKDAQIDTIRSWTGLLWGLQCFAFVVGFLLDISIVLPQREKLDLREHLIVLAALLVSHQLAHSWDPTYIRQIRLKKRLSLGTNLKVKGLDRLQLMQYALLTIRLLHLLFSSRVIDWSTATWLSGVKMLYTATVLSLLSQGGITCYAFSSLRVVEPHSISLKSRTRPSDPTSKVNKATSSQEPDLDLLSLDSTTQRRHQQEILDDDMLTNSQSNIVEEMDWSPTPDVSISQIGDDFQLGPQRFFEPVKKTGLEDLLLMQLALSERKANSEKTDFKGRMSHKIITASTLASITVFVAFMAIKLGPVEISAALDQLVYHYIPHRLQRVIETPNV
jgi:hypothetical protein